MNHRIYFNRKAYVAQKVRAFYAHKQRAAAIPENKNIYRPRPKADAVIIIRLRGKPQMQFSTSKTPFGWTISPTLAGKKVQQVLLHY